MWSNRRGDCLLGKIFITPSIGTDVLLRSHATRLMGAEAHFRAWEVLKKDCTASKGTMTLSIVQMRGFSAPENSLVGMKVVRDVRTLTAQSLKRVVQDESSLLDN